MNKFNLIIELIIKKSPFQKKKLEKYILEKDENFLSQAEDFSIKYNKYLESQNIPFEYAVDSYLELCKNMMQCQIEFMRTGKYPVSEQNNAIDEVYGNEIKMKSYMIGLAISQFLWSTHYEMYTFFSKNIIEKGEKINSYLEIGPGHGLYLNKALDYLKKNTKIQVIDISPISMKITKSIIKFFKPERNAIEFCIQDILLFSSKNKYDYITMGEVLEHVSDPRGLLCKLHELLSNKGNIFISTCANAPAIDHIYHFKNINEITDMIKECGFKIESELILPVENLQMEIIIANKIPVNYCAIIKKI